MATTAAKTKRPAKQPPASKAANSLAETEQKKAISKAIAVDELLTNVEARNQVLEPAQLDLLPGELPAIRSLGVTNAGHSIETRHQLCGLLRRVRGTNNLLRELGEPEAIDAAKKSLADAEAEVATTRAAAEDLGSTVDPAEPVLVGQIRKLQQRLAELKDVRDREALKLERLQEVYKNLLERAPQELLNTIENHICELRRRPEFQELRRLRGEVAEWKKRVEWNHPQTIRDWAREPRKIIWQFIGLHCPEFMMAGGRNIERNINAVRWQEWLDQKEHDYLPPLIEERDRLQADYDKLSADAQEPLREWMRAKRLTAEMLAQ